MSTYYNGKETEYTYEELIKANRKLKFEIKLKQLEMIKWPTSSLAAFSAFIPSVYEINKYLSTDLTNKGEIQEFIRELIVVGVTVGVAEILYAIIIFRSKKEIKHYNEEIKANESLKVCSETIIDYKDSEDATIRIETMTIPKNTNEEASEEDTKEAESHKGKNSFVKKMFGKMKSKKEKGN